MGTRKRTKKHEKRVQVTVTVYWCRGNYVDDEDNNPFRRGVIGPYSIFILFHFKLFLKTEDYPNHEFVS